MSPFEQVSTGHWPAEERQSPLKAIEADLSALLSQIGTLKWDLRDTENRARNDKKAILLGMLGILDAFDRVFANVEPRENEADRQARTWIANFRSVRRLLDRLLRHEDVHPIEAPAGKALLGLHEIVETEENADFEDDTILAELEKGYVWREEVLRKSKVTVVKNQRIRE